MSQWLTALRESSKTEKDTLNPIHGKALLAGCVRLLVGETGEFESHPWGSGQPPPPSSEINE
jgi:hypothetical protein